MVDPKINQLRVFFKNALESLGQGEFQELMLRFLPLYDPRYSNLQRHGHTVAAKTRPGTPDLLSTSLNNGNQIGVQCSTEEDYWRFTTESLNIKPFHDIDRCKDELTSLEEVVLCSNREIPTDRPNAISDVVNYARTKGIQTITPFSLAELDGILFDQVADPLFFRLFEDFFPDIARLLVTLQEAQRTATITETFNIHPNVGISSIEAICNSAFKTVKQDEIQSYIDAEIKSLGSTFEMKTFSFVGVSRTLPKDHPLLNPFGKIISLLGVPQIGKSNLIYQCIEDWKRAGISFKIYVCPEDENEKNCCISELLYRIYSSFIPLKEAADLVEGRINLEDYFQNHASQIIPTNKPQVIILDDAEFLIDKDLRFIARFLEKAQSFLISAGIGIVFVSNKPLRSRNTIFNSEVSIQPWDSSELNKLLLLNFKGSGISFDSKYVEFLEAMSVGHPRIALALAKKYPTKEELFGCLINNSFVLPDDLSIEGKQLLFEDFLKDDKDALLLVFRLTPLIFRSKMKVIQAMTQINPQIGAPIKVIIEKLFPTVIEGEDSSGYIVTSFYRKIADARLTIEEKQKIFHVASDCLLTPTTKILDVTETIDGIHYAILATKFDLALTWSIHLIYMLSKKKFKESQVKYVLDRLDITNIIKPITPRLYLSQTTLLTLKASLYSSVNDIEKAFKTIELAKPYKGDDVIDVEGKNLFEIAYASSQILKIILSARQAPTTCLKLLSNFNFKAMPESMIKNELILDLLDVSLSVGSIKDLSSKFLCEVISSCLH